jgi:DNA-binding HxlR family transcriptional regulator
VKPDHPEADCPMLLVLDRISNRWTVLVAGALSKRPLRFNELQRVVGGISHKTLSQTLKALERDGFIAREVIPTVPITVEYSITPMGATLASTLERLRLWAAENYNGIVEARAAFDDRAAIAASRASIRGERYAGNDLGV